MFSQFGSFMRGCYQPSVRRMYEIVVKQTCLAHARPQMCRVTCYPLSNRSTHGQSRSNSNRHELPHTRQRIHWKYHGVFAHVCSPFFTNEIVSEYEYRHHYTDPATSRASRVFPVPCLSNPLQSVDIVQFLLRPSPGPCCLRSANAAERLVGGISLALGTASLAAVLDARS